jgi:hypothetical protein
MNTVVRLAVAAAITVAPILGTASAARAGDGDVAAGVAGGLLGGMILGGALAQHPYYSPPPPPPVYYEDEPVYVRHCYWTRGRPYWDDWSGTWRRPRVRVCD